jgi:hypothetical protein
MKRRPAQLGDYPVTSFVRLGKIPIPQTGVVDTGTRYSVIPAALAKEAGAVPTGRSGTLRMLRRKIHGQLVRIHVGSLDGRCSGETLALVPDAGEPWARGLMFGGEYLQDTGMHVNDRGETYCPVRRKR